MEQIGQEKKNHLPENFSLQTIIVKKKKTLIVITFMLIDVISLFPSHIGQMFSSKFE